MLDAGILLAGVYNTAGGADKIEGGLLLGKKTENFQYLGNFIAEREVGEDSGDDTEYGMRFSGAYKMSDHFKPGLEWFSEFGDFDNDFDEQEHQFGPVVYGHIGEKLGYDAGVLFGVSDEAPDAVLKLNLEYHFDFSGHSHRHKH